MNPKGNTVIVAGFTGVDRRRMAGRDPRLLEELENAYVGRDGVAARRGALAFLGRRTYPPTAGGDDFDALPTCCVAHNRDIAAPAAWTDEETRYIEREMHGIIGLPKGDVPNERTTGLPETESDPPDGEYTSSFDILAAWGEHLVLGSSQGTMIRGYGFPDGWRLLDSPGPGQLDTYDWTTPLTFADGTYMEIAPTAWSAYQGPTEFAMLDTSNTGTGSNYVEVLCANGFSQMQRYRDGRLTTAVLTGSGVDPVDLNEILRARLISIWQRQLWAVTSRYRNTVFVCSAPLNHFDFDVDSYEIPIDSGTDSPITSIRPYGGAQYVFTREQVWRIRYPDLVAQHQLDIGCPSRTGVARISTGREGDASFDSAGKLVFITDKRTVVISDGATAHTISTEIQDILDGLTEWQLTEVVAVPGPRDGLVIFLWPRADGDATEGVMYDALRGAWVSTHLKWAYRIRCTGVLNTDAGPRYICGIDRRYDDDPMLAGSHEAGANITGAYGISNYNWHLGGVAAFLWDEEAPYDFAWDMPYYESGTLLDHAIGYGTGITQKVRTQPYDFGQPHNNKVLTNVMYEMEPVGYWAIKSQIWKDGKFQPGEMDIHAALRDPDAGFMDLGVARHDVHVLLPYQRYHQMGQIRGHAHYLAVGLAHEPEDDAALTTSSDGNAEYRHEGIARASGFRLAGITAAVESGGPMEPKMARSHG